MKIKETHTDILDIHVIYAQDKKELISPWSNMESAVIIIFLITASFLCTGNGGKGPCEK